MLSQKIVIEGGLPLRGEIKIQGAKNSSLPIIAGALLCEGETVLENCPRISDAYSSCRILSSLGCRCSLSGNVLTVSSDSMNSCSISEELMSEMRSSIIYMGALLGSKRECRMSFPGGCELGPRPIDMHIDAVKRLGAKIKEEHGIIECSAPNGLRGTKIILNYPSVGTTENIMLAAVKAEGETVISNAAMEPEIVDLAEFLNRCGGRIKGAGTGKIVIDGVKRLYGCTYRIMPDRIAAATYISAAAATGGEINILGMDGLLCDSFISAFEQMGCYVYIYDNRIYVNAERPLRSVGKIITMPHPGFPTDAQAVVMASLCRARGSSIFVENIFESRYRHVDALVKMGANIKVSGKTAVVTGVKKLYGAKVSATDLRGGAAMAVAGLSAEGITEISDIFHIDRGYEDIDGVISSLGGRIKRM